MQAAVAECLGVSEDKIAVDYGKKTVSVDLGGSELDKTKLASGLEGTKYSLVTD